MPAPAQPHARNMPCNAHADERTPHRGIFPTSRNSIAMKSDPISFSTDNSTRHRDYQNAKVAKHNKVSHQPHINIPFASGRSTNIKKKEVCESHLCLLRSWLFLFISKPTIPVFIQYNFNWPGGERGACGSGYVYHAHYANDANYCPREIKK